MRYANKSDLKQARSPTLPRERLGHLARRLHRLGERPLFEFLREVEAGADLHERLEKYASLPADFIRELGGDRLPIARVVKPSRDEGGRR